jgi:hypothetical protein
MNEQRFIRGTILSAQGTYPGPASGITYTIRADLPEGPVTLTGQAPNAWRWPDELDIDPEPMLQNKRRRVLGVLMGQWDTGRAADIEWLFIEPPAFGPCEPGGAGALSTAEQIRRRERFVPAVPSPGSVVGQQAPGEES